MKKYLITMTDRYMTMNEASAIKEVLNSIQGLENKFKIRKIGYEAYTIKINMELEKYLVPILNTVNECEAKVYATKKSYKELENNHIKNMKTKKLVTV